VCTECVTEQSTVDCMLEEAITNFKGPLRALADKKVSISSKKRLLNQRGGFLVPLLSAILPTIASLIFRSRRA